MTASMSISTMQPLICLVSASFVTRLSLIKCAGPGSGKHVGPQWCHRGYASSPVDKARAAAALELAGVLEQGEALYQVEQVRI